MGGRFVLVVFLGLALLHLPLASADDSETSANTLTDGVSSSGYVCSDDGCSPKDKQDYWKIQGKMGDIIQVTFSGSMSNPNWLCIKVFQSSLSHETVLRDCKAHPVEFPG